MELQQRDLERLRELENMAGARDEEIAMLRKQLVQVPVRPFPPSS